MNLFTVGMSFPNKEDRQRCWDARDKYWECLDKAGDETTPCALLRKVYENSCSSQWVKHFDRKRNYLQFKSKIESDGISSTTIHKSKFQKRRVYHEIVGL
ncbi:hypothetical protein HHI36_011426 [Cryptolaemus montrouzieri]|uniref:Cytochrome c oxidase assembly factor 6 homolog n=1 Tax=Cryptolaemus montrouzieri TaxID=559131 RepID=A0ABD2MLS3_9CUCU